MEQAHKKQIKFLFCATYILSFLLRWNYTAIAGDSISFISIALAVYTLSLGALIGSDFAKILQKTCHHERKDLTLLDMITNYMKLGIKISMVTIVLSLLVKLDHSFLLNIIHNLISREYAWKVFYFVGRQTLMSICFSFLALNFLLMWYVFTFIINRQVENR